MMDTPICDFVKKYADGCALRLHMPGHKGKSFLGCEKLDITEIAGADVLYSPGGIIRKSEDNAASLFGAARTVYSCEGSSLSIRAMLYMVCLYANANARKPLVLSGRNSHKTFVTAAALLDLDVAWLYGENTGYLSCNISSEYLDSVLRESADKPVAVYVTSPDYLGNMLDIKALAEVCHRHGVLLLVDNAHGAYLKFLPESMHPIDLGADMCCDSAHKTLPVLTGGAYLHISESAPAFFSDNAEKAMSIFASTSPSYLILQSLDTANKYLSDQYQYELSSTTEAVDKLKSALIERGYTLVGNEPMKIALDAKAYGHTGTDIAGILRQKNIEVEFSDPDFVVMMFTPQNGDCFSAIADTFMRISQKTPINAAPRFDMQKRFLSLRKALLSPVEKVSIADACGRICADINVSCPPAVPIVMPGEIIDENAVDALKYYGKKNIDVLTNVKN